ncbi:MAG: elongation factor Ts [Clostridia bacterium]|nr:elongation factor Ts [Clostridia bacterium]
MAFTAKDVADLRAKTGAGMMDCKNALKETDGDIEKAIDVLREKGLAKAAKKAGRTAAEGVVLAYSDDNGATVLVEVNSETDFVAKNEKFRDLVLGVAKTVAANDPATVEELQEMTMVGKDETVAAAFQEAVLSIGENMQIRRFVRVTDPAVTYIHGGGSVGVIVTFDAPAEVVGTDAFIEMGKNVAMQVAAMSPEYVRQSEIPAEELAKLRNITIESALNTPDSLPRPILNKVISKAIEDGLLSEADLAAYEAEKNNKFLFNFLSKEAVAAFAGVAVSFKETFLGDMIFNKAVEGRIAKQLKEICLEDQTYVKDDKYNVKGYVDSVAKELGVSIAIKSFYRYAKGEGIEKRNDDFAAEIASMVK